PNQTCRNNPGTPTNASGRGRPDQDSGTPRAPASVGSAARPAADSCASSTGYRGRAGAAALSRAEGGRDSEPASAATRQFAKRPESTVTESAAAAGSKRRAPNWGSSPAPPAAPDATGSAVAESPAAGSERRHAGCRLIINATAAAPATD